MKTQSILMVGPSGGLNEMSPIISLGIIHGPHLEGLGGAALEKECRVTGVEPEVSEPPVIPNMPFSASYLQFKI